MDELVGVAVGVGVTPEWFLFWRRVRKLPVAPNPNRAPRRMASNNSFIMGLV